MILRKFARALLMIAAGLLACWVARADSVIVTAIGASGQVFDNRLPAMYSDDLATFELTSNSPFDLAGNPLGVTGLDEPAFPLPFSFSVAWATSFSNLSLPADLYWQMTSDPSAPPDFRDWVAAMPPDFEVAPDDMMMSFSELNSPPRDYWDLLREPSASPDFRNWLAELPPSFEIARDWGPDL